MDIFILFDSETAIKVDLFCDCLVIWLWTTWWFLSLSLFTWNQPQGKELNNRSFSRSTRLKILQRKSRGSVLRYTHTRETSLVARNDIFRQLKEKDFSMKVPLNRRLWHFFVCRLKGFLFIFIAIKIYFSSNYYVGEMNRTTGQQVFLFFFVFDGLMNRKLIRRTIESQSTDTCLLLFIPSRLL